MKKRSLKEKTDSLTDGKHSWLCKWLFCHLVNDILFVTLSWLFVTLYLISNTNFLPSKTDKHYNGSYYSGQLLIAFLKWKINTQDIHKNKSLRKWFMVTSF